MPRPRKTQIEASAVGAKKVRSREGEYQRQLATARRKAKTFDDLPDSAHISVAQACVIAGISPATYYRSAGQSVPAIKKVGQRCVVHVGSLRKALGL